MILSNFFGFSNHFTLVSIIANLKVSLLSETFPSCVKSCDNIFTDKFLKEERRNNKQKSDRKKT